MATIGLDKLFYAKITEDEDGNETYAAPTSLAKAMTAELSVELAEATLYADDGAAELWEAVSRLPEGERTAVHLHYAEGYRTEEIAAMLRVPAATVRTRLRRARMRLKDLLGGTDDEGEQISERSGEHLRAHRA